MQILNNGGFLLLVLMLYETGKLIFPLICVFYRISVLLCALYVSINKCNIHVREKLDCVTQCEREDALAQVPSESSRQILLL